MDANPAELSDSLKSKMFNSNGLVRFTSTVEKGYFKPEEGRSDVTDKSLSPVVGSKLELEAVVTYD
ncbi:hypothetical protein SAY87_007921 [Trapa incisa]|uniref:Uncharacterized protein n=1 Tax=Trapa incisa TaxID=236973 RepID=A0AAN7QFT8_9MYRT|nr:hypothetical protein SAY87_007921 [Trapa incisa]